MQTKDGWLVRDVYIDESSQTKHRYLVLGALTMDAGIVEVFNNGLAERRLPELPNGEMAWVKVSRGKFEAYKRVVDYFFWIQDFTDIEFHALVVDTSKLNHRAYNDGSRDTGFSKEVYQLAQKCRRQSRDRVFHVYPDKRNTAHPPSELRDILNAGARKKGDERPWPFRRVQFRDSAACPPIQLTDILTGALAYRLNRHHLEANASEAKRALSAHVLARADIATVMRDTAVSGPFTLWHRILR